MNQSDTPSIKLTQEDHVGLDRMSDRVQRLLRGIVESEEVGKILDAEEERKAARRAALCKRRAELLAASEYIDPKLLRVVNDAAATVARLEEALPAARDALQLARGALDHNKSVKLQEAAKIARELHAGRDQRLLDFRLALSKVMDVIVEKLDVVEVKTRRFGFGYETVWRTNAAEVKAANDACKAVHTRTFEAEIEAHTFNQVTALMQRWADELSPVLAVLQLRPPRVSKDTGEVKAALPWDVPLTKAEA